MSGLRWRTILVDVPEPWRERVLWERDELRERASDYWCRLHNVSLTLVDAEAERDELQLRAAKAETDLATVLAEVGKRKDAAARGHAQLPLFWLKWQAAQERAEKAEGDAERQKKHNLEVLTPKLERLAEACRRKDVALVDQMGLVRRAEAAEAKLREAERFLGALEERVAVDRLDANRLEAIIAERAAEVAAQGAELERLREVERIADEQHEAAMKMSEKHRRSWVRASQDLAAKDAELDSWRKEAEAVLSAIHGTVRVREGGGYEDLRASLAVSVVKVASDLERLRAERDSAQKENHAKTRALMQRDEMLAAKDAELEKLRAREWVLTNGANDAELARLRADNGKLERLTRCPCGHAGGVVCCEQCTARMVPPTPVVAVLSPSKDAAPDATTLPPQRSLTPEGTLARQADAARRDIAEWPEWLRQLKGFAPQRSLTPEEARETNAVTESLFSPVASPPSPVAIRDRDEALEEAAGILEETAFAPGTHTGTRQADVKRRAAAAIRALKTTPAAPVDDVTVPVTALVEHWETAYKHLRARGLELLERLAREPFCATCDVAHAGHCTPIAPTEGA